MKKLLTLAAVLAMSAPLTAFAADLPQPPPPMPRAPAFVPPPPFTWTGFYVGVNGGYSWNNWTDGLGDSFNANGGIAGGTIGFNYQWNWFVAGFEGDVDWAGNKFSQTQTDSEFGGTSVATLNYKNNVLSTFAARFGVAADHALFYGKAGGAWTQEKYTISGTDPNFGTLSASNSFDRLGWMVGAGVEYAFTNNLTAKIEYNYINFGSDNQTLTLNTSTLGPLTGTITSKPTMNVVKVGLNWLFNGS
ncbi:MAG TPA: outer membrane beta-barrel protein [Xanthobacteraceae bacterium]|nr:outer membrane beta-barrel protein [Xanthobacteraceae bacterium]